MEGWERGTGGAERPEWSGHRRQETDYDISNHIRSRAQLRRVAAQCPNRKRPGCRCRTGRYDRTGRLTHPESDWQRCQAKEGSVKHLWRRAPSHEGNKEERLVRKGGESKGSTRW